MGQVDDLSSPIPGLFKGAEDGTKAYFAYINSQGGVNGRKIKLDAQDSTFQGGQVATVTGTQIRTDFALVGGFSLLDSAEKPLIDIAARARRRLLAEPRRSPATPTSTARCPTPLAITTLGTSSST